MATFRPVLFCLFLTGGAAAAEIALVRDLYGERQWLACQTEARRILAEQPRDFEALLYRARADARLGRENALPELEALAANPNAPEAVRAPARYEAALQLWRQGQRAAAANNLREVFLLTADRQLFLESGCALTLVLREQPMPWRDMETINAQLQTAAPQWTPDLIQSVRREWAPAPDSGRAGRSLIAFYRSQIRPAIGDRCLLQPSCSEYSRQAFKKHGMLAGVAMTADRFVREPGVVAAAAVPVVCRGRVYYGDPLRDHDWWFDRQPDDNQENQ